MGSLRKCLCEKCSLWNGVFVKQVSIRMGSLRIGDTVEGGLCRMMYLWKSMERDLCEMRSPWDGVSVGQNLCRMKALKNWVSGAKEIAWK